MDFLDNSKIEQYLRCPRAYWYRYVLGWKSERTSVDLVWGEAWHRVLAAHYIGGQVDECVQAGVNYYREHFSPADDADNLPKTAGALDTCFHHYIQTYEKEDAEYTTLAVEVGFRLEIAPGVWMTGRVDRIAQDNITGDIVIQDHKSSKKMPDGKGVNQWQMSGQAACYLSAVKRKFPEHHVREFQINLTVPRIPTSKLRTGLQRISVQLTEEQLREWVEETVCTQGDIQAATRNVNDPGEHPLYQKNELRQGFRRNQTSCYDFGRLCSFFDQCTTWVNPLEHIQQGPPRGMVVEHWNPLEDLKCGEEWELPLSTGK